MQMNSGNIYRVRKEKLGMHKKNILFIKGESQYDAMRNYIDDIEDGFRINGYNTCVVDSKEESTFEFKIQQISRKLTIDFVFTCNAIYIELEWFRKLFPKAYFITYLCDHPASIMDRLDNLNDRCIVFACDEFHEEYIKKFYPNIGYAKFIPLSGNYFKTHIPYDERKMDIVFTGTYKKPEKIDEEILKELNDISLTYAKYMINSMIEDPTQDLEQCLRNTLENFGQSVTEKRFHELAYKFSYTDWYAKFYYRDKLLRTLLRSGLSIHVFGNGWEDFDGEERQNLIIEKGNYYVAQKAVANAKIALNIMPWFKAGFQERIATAMFSGTVAVTDNSKYITENFIDGKDIILYDLERLDELPQKIKEILKNQEKAQQIAQNGQIHAMLSLSWQHRVTEMLQYMGQMGIIENTQKSLTGVALTIPYDSFYIRSIGLEAIHGMQEILSMLEEVKQYSKVQKSDIRYFYNRFLKEFMKLKANYPEIGISETIYDYLSNITDETANFGMELLERECSHILASVFSMEYVQQNKDNEQLRRELQVVNTRPNLYLQKILINHLNQKYADTKNAIIQEILANINRNGWVNAYNQNFIYKHGNDIQDLVKLVDYDTEADMCYARWNGKKMYYPKDYSQMDVASALDFVLLEQDMNSPHRYLDDSFQVKEGDIVIDAGVAEGNFALDIVDIAKKIYLVECEHKWVEALQKTFEPWKDKVVIIEKMLGDKNDDQYISIDEFVTEGYVNFVKMDVEGAEIDSLKGASKVLKNSKDIQCAICAYHRKNAERDIRHILEKHGFYTSTTQGYMFFKEDADSWIDAELRHGLVRATKRC